MSIKMIPYAANVLVKGNNKPIANKISAIPAMILIVFRHCER